MLSKIKLGRLGTVEDLMGAVVFLASDASALMTGSSLVDRRRLECILRDAFTAITFTDRPLSCRALAGVRTLTHSAALLGSGCDGAQRRRRLGSARRLARSASPTRPARTTATSRGWPFSATAGDYPGAHDQPPVQLGPRRGGSRGARHQVAEEAEARPRRRGGKHERAPLVMAKATEAFSRRAEIEEIRP